MLHGEAHRIAVFGKTDRTVRCGRVWSNPDLYPTVKREAVELVPLNFDSLLITIGNLFPMRKSWVLFLPHDLG